MRLNYEKSCGAVVFTRINNNIMYLLIQNLEGIYGFPKGGRREASQSSGESGKTGRNFGARKRELKGCG